MASRSRSQSVHSRIGLARRGSRRVTRITSGLIKLGAQRKSSEPAGGERAHYFSDLKFAVYDLISCCQCYLCRIEMHVPLAFSCCGDLMTTDAGACASARHSARPRGLGLGNFDERRRLVLAGRIALDVTSSWLFTLVAPALDFACRTSAAGLRSSKRPCSTLA